MMNAVGEPDSLQIDNESLPIGIVLLSIIIYIYGFENLSQAKPVAAVLVPKDVTPEQCCFGKIIHKKLLSERQKMEAWNVVPQQLKVGKTLFSHFSPFAFFFGVAFLAFFLSGFDAGGTSAFGVKPCASRYSFGVIPQSL